MSHETSSSPQSERPREPIEILPPLESERGFSGGADYFGRAGRRREPLFGSAFGGRARVVNIGPVGAMAIGVGALTIFGVLVLFLASALLLMAPIALGGAALAWFLRPRAR